MKYIGIDLGTTNSAICSYDGETVRLHKSSEGNDVSPSAIFIDRRGNKFLGTHAYTQTVKDPKNVATKFKRMMGTSTPIKFASTGTTLSPEECSAEILKLCFGYVPEEIRGEEIATVITVPAAFNQMQKEATLTAAELAGLGKVALMQEPVAAIMSAVRQRKSDSTFLIFDLGGGTLDIAIAESINGRVNLLAHGGIAMCGGADFDREIFDNIVKPWLFSTFDLPDDFSVNPKYRALLSAGLWTAEKAKIELSVKEESVISLDEADIHLSDESGEEIYIDIPLSRSQLDSLIAAKENDAIQCARDILEKTHLNPSAIASVVFVGGPTCYKPLRDRVAFQLGIAASTEVNPMTAVAEGAAIFAESIDWASESRGRKSSRGSVNAGEKLKLSFAFIARTTEAKAKLSVRLPGQPIPGAEFQIDSLDEGRTYGRQPLKHGAAQELDLPKQGENTFKVFVFDASGGPIEFAENTIVISRVAATIDAIPASRTLSIEVLDRIGAQPVLDLLVREGESLPARGTKTYQAVEALRASSDDSLKFKLWEGEGSRPGDDTELVGMFEIKGSDLMEGMIPIGAELIFSYEMQDSGHIAVDVTVPAVKGSFKSDSKFYSSRGMDIDFTRASAQVKQEANRTLQRLNEISENLDDPKLDLAREKLLQAQSLKMGETDAVTNKEAMQLVRQAQQLIGETRKRFQPETRSMELTEAIEQFERLRRYANPAEATAFENLVKTAKRELDKPDGNFDSYLDEIQKKNFLILWRQDWFVIDRFNFLQQSPHLFPHGGVQDEVLAAGYAALEKDDIGTLRNVVIELDSMRIFAAGMDDMSATSNILRK